MTDKRFKYGSNERWECVLIDTLEKKEYDFCEVGKLCNRLWEQTQRFENHNKDLMEENEQLRNRIKDWHQRTFKAHEYFNILEKVIDEVCDDNISNQIWKEYEKREKLIE